MRIRFTCLSTRAYGPFHANAAEPSLWYLLVLKFRCGLRSMKEHTGDRSDTANPYFPTLERSKTRALARGGFASELLCSR